MQDALYIECAKTFPLILTYVVWVVDNVMKSKVFGLFMNGRDLKNFIIKLSYEL